MINFDKLNFYNMVHINKTELKRIINGEQAMKVMSYWTRKRLRERGILVYINHHNKLQCLPKRTLTPSCLTLMILDGLLDVNDFME